MLMKRSFSRAEWHHVELRKHITRMLSCIVWIMIGFISMSSPEAFAFWTNAHPQHQGITMLIRWDNMNNWFLDINSTEMGEWSEEPDEGKDWLFAHGDEKERAIKSFNAAITHFRKYINGNVGEFELAGGCLGHAYHYFEDLGDFSEGSENTRNVVNTALDKLSADPKFVGRIEAAKKKIKKTDLDSIFEELSKLKSLKDKFKKKVSERQVEEAIIKLVACLELVNRQFMVWAGINYRTPMDFNGIDSSVDMGSLGYQLDNLHDNNNVFSVSLWFKTGSDKRGQTLIGNYIGCSYSPQGFELIVYSDKTGFTPYMSLYNGGKNAIECNRSFADNSWHHAVAVFDNDHNRYWLFVDGSAVRTRKGKYQPTDHPVKIGSADVADPNCGVTGESFFEGQIGDVALYNFVLSPNEIGKIFSCERVADVDKLCF